MEENTRVWDWSLTAADMCEKDGTVEGLILKELKRSTA